MSNMRDLWYDWLGVNTWLFKKINELSDIPVYSSLMKFVTVFGDKKLLPYIVAMIAIFFIISFIARVFTKKGGNNTYLFLWVNIFLVMGAGLFAVNHTISYIKNQSAYPRPYVVLPAKSIIQLEFQPAEDANRSFPSGHVAIITILVMALWPVLSENFRWGGILLIFGVAWSRMALGVHFPMDVLSGFFITFIEIKIISFIIYRITGLIFRTRC